MHASIFSKLPPEEITALHQSWKNDPLSVDPLWAAWFEGYELGSGEALGKKENTGTDADTSLYTVPPESAEGRGRISLLIRAYRVMGHQCARFNPLEPPDRPRSPVNPEDMGFREEDLDQPVNIGTFMDGGTFTLREIINRLQKIYCGAIGFEYHHIDNLEIRSWIEEKIQLRANGVDYGPEVRREAFFHLCRAELFEEFLGKRFMGKKRFSLEGGEGAIVLLDAMIKRCPVAGVSHIEMGMAHRGRLNVLANILHKPLKTIFHEFTPDYLPESPIGRSDVKYHLGYAATRHVDGHDLHIRLSSNPSHLEAVYPVVEGRARAMQHNLQDAERKHVLPLVLHGDAAFSGQGIVAEVLNLSLLKGYRTGGTVHLVINNQIGFTTGPDEARSSRYATDVAQMLQSPILHINGESPEDLVWAADFALQFRQKFGRDIILDMYCYRRLGHNETDQAAFTAPMQTKRIEARPTAAALYGTALRERGELTEQQERDIRKDLWEGMEQAYLQMKENSADYLLPATAQDADETPIPRTSIRTGISPELFQRIGNILTELPDGFTPHPTLEKRFLARRREAFREGEPLDWAMAESLAWGSLLAENHTVRLSGQDCQRGTFSQRHAVLHDFNDGSLYTPLEKLNHGTTAFRIYNSSLSEASVLGFEYGYALDSPDALVMWEAQFGDFANGAQVIVDQFIAAAEAKWRQKNRMVLLLPHGYEGAGSEHSSARMERYLQLCADDNMQVINPTTPAQYFHALRRQVHRNLHKPLIVFTPKSLLSRPEAVSPHREFLAPSRFREVLPDPDAPAPDQVTRAVFCTGKVYYDLAAYRKERNIADTVIIRLEQIYPLAREQLTFLLAPYQKVRDFVWCQEEPSNMGAWGHLRNRLGRLFATSFRYAGRPPMACPAEGAKALHAAAQKRLLAAAFGPRAQS
ncbi:2-oxoglutarate dehydrogenase E1 component [Akkermansia muciniphila]|uniref:2-oxoglutarate dehydrogenase E1 component n=1 Tax=Akkermansia muciniphila TaxID=239935 RepID=UPI0027D2D72D|nr:2-oxoglutarate dehydrogenase E1 component [Akkermansia muciniphila]WMB14738.1 2-oxoglutarate dehydrogenase E1 component [Akkermansia muciniphila]WMB19222.1 2-oxoglutarate dehydrogenase E1 component [Akkermansia muciniphila]